MIVYYRIPFYMFGCLIIMVNVKLINTNSIVDIENE